MKSKKKNKDSQSFEILNKYLDIKKQEPTANIRIFFNLIYLKSPCEYILTNNPFESLQKAQSENKNFDIAECCAILLTCNPQNIEMFVKIPIFSNLCSIFSPRFSELSHHLESYIKCIQASILYYLDSKAIKSILKKIKLLRESGIITFHDEKCIEASLQNNKLAQNNKAKNVTQESSDISFIDSNISKSVFKIQLESILKAKKILKNISWASKLANICEVELLKNICIVGRRKSGKSTLIATLLYSKNEHNAILEAKAPMQYMYGKSHALIKYMEFSDLKSLQESPLPKVSALFKTLQESYNANLKEGKEKLEINKIYENLYPTQKIEIIDHINIFLKSNVLKYVNFINTPSLIPLTFRHLQIYHYVIQSNIIFYMINADIFMQNAQAQIDKDAISIARIINKEHIEHVYIIYTQMDKVGLTLKKRQNIYLKFKNAIFSHLECDEIKKQELLKKILFFYVASSIAYKIRNGVDVSNESGLDLASSGIPSLEKELYNHIFESSIKHFNIKILKNILRLLNKNYFYTNEFLDIKDFINNLAPKYFDDVSSNLESLKNLLQDALDKLPTKYSSFYSAFTNLRDNLYSQFIQSLNYEIKNKSAFNVKRLKISTIESLIVGLQGLSEMLQDNFFNLYEFKAINRLLNPKSPSSFMRLANTSEHREILEILYSEFLHITKQNLFDDSNVIVTEHLSNMLDNILPDDITKQEIKEDSVIKPIKESFEYYFLLLERNINMLFNTRISNFNNYIQLTTNIIESMFIKYYKDTTNYENSEYKEILNILDKG